MSQEFVPSVGPVLDPSESPTLLEGMRGTVNGVTAAPAATLTAPIFRTVPEERIAIRTRTANEQIRATLNVDRDNTGAESGLYQITLDGGPVGPAAPGPTGTNQQRTVVIDAMIGILLPGDHFIGAQVTSGAAFVESALLGSGLIVEAQEFV